MPINIENKDVKNTFHIAQKSKIVFQTATPFTQVKSTLSSLLKLEKHPQPDQKISKVSLKTLSTPFFSDLFSRSSFPIQEKLTFAQPFFLWKTNQKSLSTPDFLLLERFSDTIKKYPSEKSLKQLIMPLDFEGTLKKTEQGFFYLDISNKFMDTLFPYLTKDGAHKPLFPMGAHIPVISCEESEIYQLHQKVDEVGLKIPFSPKEIITITPAYGPLEKVWAILIDCEKLSHIREKYHLTSKFCSQDFMIILGAKPKTTPQNLSDQEIGFFRINPAQLPA